MQEWLHRIITKAQSGDIGLSEVLPAFLTIALIFFLVFVPYDLGTAKRLQIDGRVKNITWDCTGRDQPNITVTDQDKGIKILCHHTIILTRKDIKVGDYIVKKKGSITAMINEEKIQFARD
jgi:hypothetical protein